MTSEQKKKLKKKNKKKRQQNAKKSSQEFPNDLSLVDQEMKLMESASEPLSYSGAFRPTNDYKALSYDALDAAAGPKARSRGQEGSEEKMKKGSSSSSILDRYSDDDGCSWLSRSLFAELNFSTVSSSSRQKPAMPVAKMFQSLPFDMWESPLEESYAKLTMITSVRKVFSFLGPPVSEIVASFAEAPGDPLLSEEYCHVLSNSDWLLEVISDSQRTPDGCCQFTVRGHGFEEDGICQLASACLFEVMGRNEEGFRQIYHPSIADSPVVWTITHNTCDTKEIVQFIEAQLAGVAFLCHVHAMGCALSEDDTAMSKLVSSLCVHPLPSQEEETCFGLLGLDVEMLVSSIRQQEQSCVDHCMPPMDWLQVFPRLDSSAFEVLPTHHTTTQSLRPLQERYNFFAGNTEGILKLIDSFQLSPSGKGAVERLSYHYNALLE